LSRPEIPAHVYPRLPITRSCKSGTNKAMATDLQFTRLPFEPGDTIPAEYTCEGDDVSPPLEWSGVPDGTETFALIVDDPDAPGQTFVHWVCFNLSGNATRLVRDVDVADAFAGASATPQEGSNDFNDIGYGGPCPPPGDDPHRYVFRLYALDTVLDLGAGASKQQVTDAMDGHVLAEADLMGTFAR